MKGTRCLPTVTTRAFDAAIRKRAMENPIVLRAATAYLHDARGYAFRLPKRGTPVILLLSGGMDSCVAWHLLIKRHELDVYPLFTDNGRSPGARRAIRAISAWMRDRHAHAWREPYVMPQQYLPADMERTIRAGRLTPEALLSAYDRKIDRIHVSSLHGTNALTATAGATYSQYLRLTTGVSADTIFCGVTGDDGNYVRSQTFTFLRVATVFLTQLYGNERLQYASPFLERETGSLIDKSAYMGWAVAQGFPLEKTYSCSMGTTENCGECMTCRARRHAFEISGITDRTVYVSNDLVSRAIARVRRMLSRVTKRRGILDA